LHFLYFGSLTNQPPGELGTHFCPNGVAHYPADHPNANADGSTDRIAHSAHWCPYGSAYRQPCPHNRADRTAYEIDAQADGSANDCFAN
jgi:hypothetical protein